AAPRSLPGRTADAAKRRLRRRAPGQDHDLPRPARAHRRLRPGAFAPRGRARRPARGRPPLRHRRRTARRARPLLANRPDDVDELVGSVAVRAREADELPRALDDRAALGGAGDGDTAAAAELEQAFVAKRAERAQDGVGVDAEDSREVAGRRQPLARPGLAVRDRAADLGRDLLVELRRFGAVDLDTKHGASDTSFIMIRSEGVW